MTDIDTRGRAAANDLRARVDQAIDEPMITLAFEQVISGQHVAMSVQPTRRTAHRGRLALVLAVAAAILVTLIVVAQRDDKPPVEPPPVPTTTPTTAASTTAAPTTTSEPPPERGTTSLDSIGPPVGFGPYPPQVVVLPDGKVLKLAGSFGDPNTLDVLDPSTGEVTNVGTTLVGRTFPAMVLLDDGRLLLAGGDMTPMVTEADGSTHSEYAAMQTGEVFDFRTGSSISAGPMISRRYISKGTRLGDGSVLIVGNDANDQGLVDNPIAELYDPATNSFRRTGDRTVADQPTELFTLNDGRALVFGAHPELYDAATATFTPVDAPTIDWPTAVVQLQDGTILSTSDYCSEDDPIEEDGVSAGHRPIGTQLFDPDSGDVTPGPDIPHCVTAAATMADGRVFVTGYWWSGTPPPPHNPYGGSRNEVRWAGILDVDTGTTTFVPNPTRRSPAPVVLPDGRVLLVAGAATDVAWADVYP